MYKFLLLVLFFYLLCLPAVQGQNNFVPHSAGEGVNTEYDELNPILSPDGQTLFFVRVNHPENNYGIHNSQDIWYCELQPDGTWSQAKRLGNHLNGARHNAVLAISADGKTMLINGRFGKKSVWLKRGLSVSQKLGNYWSDPRKLKVKAYSRMNKGAYSNVYMSPDGQKLFFSFTKKFNGKRLDLYVSDKHKGKFKKPKKIGKPVSTKYSEEAPFWNDSTSTLYFSSNRGKNIKNYDVYYTKPLDKKWEKWSEPEKLSDTINSIYWESYFKTTSNGSWAYYVSTKNGNADIFKVKLFEENPYVVVEGMVRNEENREVLYPQTTFSIWSNGVEIDPLQLDSSTGAYTIKLPLGHTYTLEAKADNFISVSAVIDVRNEKEYQEVKKDLLLKPLPYVLVKGKILIADTNEPLASSSQPVIYVNKVLADSVKMDTANGTYELKLIRGNKYELELKANGYIASTKEVDLTEVKYYQEIENDLLVEKFVQPEVASVLITGKVYDNKTKETLSPNTHFEIFVNDTVSSDFIIVRDSAWYSIHLPIGNKYSLSASASDYYPVYEFIDLSKAKAQTTLIKDLYLSPLEVGQSVKLNNILFETGKATLKKESYPELDKVVKFLNTHPSIKIRIEGHTDNVGKAATNLKLSEDRAAAVAVYIISQGIAADRIRSHGYGMEKPIASNTTTAGRELNRRVEFTILER
ncbi:MAG TPA: OmpA family protein [Cytophagaceae bacterium]